MFNNAKQTIPSSAVVNSQWSNNSMPFASFFVFQPVLAQLPLLSLHWYPCLLHRFRHFRLPLPVLLLFELSFYTERLQQLTGFHVQSTAADSKARAYQLSPCAIRSDTNDVGSKTTTLAEKCAGSSWISG